MANMDLDIRLKGLGTFAGQMEYPFAHVIKQLARLRTGAHHLAMRQDGGSNPQSLGMSVCVLGMTCMFHLSSQLPAWMTVF